MLHGRQNDQHGAPASVVAQAPPAPQTPAPPATGGGGGGGTALASSAPAASFAPTTISSGAGGGSGGGGGGGGGGKKKKKKQKQQPIAYDGIVVRVNPVAQSYTIASNGGLIAIHGNTLPQVGDQVKSPVRKLSNGTYAEQGNRAVQGQASSANFLGTVTSCADLEHRSTPCSGTPPSSDHFVYSVSSVGASVMVSSPPAAPLPVIGAQVQVGVNIGAAFTPIDPVPTTDFTPYGAPCNPGGTEQNGVPAPPPTTGSLTQTSLSVTAQQTSALIEGVVQQTGCTPNGLVVSSDDIREAGRDLVPLNVPAGIDQSKLTRGEAVQADVAVASDGSLTLKGITSDQGVAGADDASQGQGTLVGS